MDTILSSSCWDSFRSMAHDHTGLILQMHILYHSRTCMGEPLPVVGSWGCVPFHVRFGVCWEPVRFSGSYRMSLSPCRLLDPLHLVGWEFRNHIPTSGRHQSPTCHPSVSCGEPGMLYGWKSRCSPHIHMFSSQYELGDVSSGPSHHKTFSCRLRTPTMITNKFWVMAFKNWLIAVKIMDGIIVTKKKRLKRPLKTVTSDVDHFLLIPTKY